jgi:2-oxoglutarate ferredoxin oxidoreductase subunit gamma
MDAKQMELPVYQNVMDRIGNAIVFSICVLGVLIGITEILCPESVMKVIQDRVLADFVAKNNLSLDIKLVFESQSRQGWERNMPWSSGVSSTSEPWAFSFHS